jgi:hypothetical protein
MLLIVLLAACGTETATPQQVDTPEPTQEQEPTIEARPTSFIDEALDQLPPPGTPLIPVTEEASSDPSQTPFTGIVYQETGGLAATSLYIEIYPDGRVIRDGVESRIAQPQIDEIIQALVDSHFFGIQGQFTRPGAGADISTYVVTVELENGSFRRLEAQDGSTPPDLLRLFSLLRQAGL